MGEKTDTNEPGVSSSTGTFDTARENGLHPDPFDPAITLEATLEWVENNQPLAMLGAFALGVFIGVMMRE